MTTARGILCVFAKPPIPGNVKTRLAATIGEIHAANLASAFLRDTWGLASSIPWAAAVLATTELAARDLGLPRQPELWLQGDGDLGARIERIARRALAQADFVVAIGSDSPGLPERLLTQARTLLDRNDAVLGPCDDGGFYLIGLRRCRRGLLADLPWSAPTTFDAVLERLDRERMSVGILERWFDVDTPEDLDRLAAMIERGELDAEHTARAFAALPARPAERVHRGSAPPFSA